MHRLEPGRQYVVMVPQKDSTDFNATEELRARLQVNGAKVTEVVWVPGLATVEVFDITAETRREAPSQCDAEDHKGGVTATCLRPAGHSGEHGWWP